MCAALQLMLPPSALKSPTNLPTHFPATHFPQTNPLSTHSLSTLQPPPTHPPAHTTGHNGCVDCFRTVQARRAECPLCRCPFNASTPLVCNHELRDLITLATCLFLEAKTEEVEDGWEQFPTAAVTTEHYASEVKLQQLARATHTAMQPHTLSAAQPISSARNNHGYGGYNRHSSSGGGCSSSHPGDPYHHHNMQLLRTDGDGNMTSAPSAPPELGSYYDDGGNHGNGGVLALEPPQWLPDSYASSCGSCHLAFRPLVRLRHHCRLCGKVFCHACSAQEMLLPPRYAQRCVCALVICGGDAFVWFGHCTKVLNRGEGSKVRWVSSCLQASEPGGMGSKSANAA